MARLRGLGLAVLAVCCLSAVAGESAASLEFVLGESIEGQSPGASASWQPLAAGQSLGFHDAPVWLRLPPNPDALGEGARYLLVKPGHLGDVQVFTADEPTRPLLAAGTKRPATESAVGYGYTVFLSEAEVASGVLVRVQSDTLLQPSAELVTPYELQRENLRFNLSFGLAFSANLFFLFWALATAISTPSTLLVVWVARLAVYLATLFVHLGLLHPWLDGEALPAQAAVHVFFALGFITLAQFFDYLLLRELRLGKLRWVFLAVVSSFAMAKPLAWWLEGASAALQINNYSILATLLLGLVLVPMARPEGLGAFRLTRFGVGGYFLIQAVPIVALIFAGAIYAAGFGRLLELAFINYSIVPAGYITFLLFRRQRLIASERAAYEKAAQQRDLQLAGEREKRKEVGDLLDMLVHEVRAPLATLQMATRVDRLSPELVKRMIKRIDDVLGQAYQVDELELEKTEPLTVRLELQPLLEACASDQDIELVIRGEAPPVMANANALRTVLTNLFDNASKYRIENSTVLAELDYTESHVRLVIANRVAEKVPINPNRVFDKYYRGPEATGTQGAGLGLYIVRRLCGQMQGEASMQVDEHWVRVTLKLPRAGAVV